MTTASCFSQRTASLHHDPCGEGLSRLALTWEHQQDPEYDYIQFIKRNRTDTLFCLASSECYVDLVMEIWEAGERTRTKRFESPNTQTCCVEWLQDDSFITGGHDNTLTLWRDFHRTAQYLPLRLSAHRDWVRGVSINVGETSLVTGDAKSALYVWDFPRLQPLGLHVLPQYPEIELNAVMGLDFDIRNQFLYYVLQRSGHLSMGDVRTGRVTEWHTKVHCTRASSMRLSEDGVRLATSARGSEIKLWDLRKLSFPDSVNSHVQVYNQHSSEKQPLSFEFMGYERYLVSGSDSLYAYIYDTLTAQCLRKVKLSPGMVVTGSPIDRGNISFYAIYNNGQSLGLVDTEGEALSREFQSSEQIKEQYSKEAWELALSKNTDRVLKASRAAQPEVAINYEQMMAAVRASDLPICKELLQDLTDQYEENIKASTPRLVRDMQDYYARQGAAREPAVQKQESMRMNTEADTRVYMVKSERTILNSLHPVQFSAVTQ